MYRCSSSHGLYRNTTIMHCSQRWNVTTSTVGEKTDMQKSHHYNDFKRFRLGNAKVEAQSVHKGLQPDVLLTNLTKLIIIIIIIIIIALKSAIRDFLQSPHGAVNTCAQVARAQSCANYVQHIEHLSRAACHLVRRDSSAIKFDRI